MGTNVNPSAEAEVSAIHDLPLLAVTLGDSAGVGPEIVAGALAEGALRDAARVLVVGDGELLAARARRVGLRVELAAVASPEEMREAGLEEAWLESASGGAPEDVLGRADPAAGTAAVAWIRAAAGLALANEADGFFSQLRIFAIVFKFDHQLDSPRRSFEKIFKTGDLLSGEIPVNHPADIDPGQFRIVGFTDAPGITRHFHQVRIVDNDNHPVTRSLYINLGIIGLLPNGYFQG